MAEQPSSLEHMLLGAHRSDAVKTHIEYDGLARTEYVYTANANAKDGDPCLVTRYAYVTTTSRVEFMKEYTATWDSSWEVF